VCKNVINESYVIANNTVFLRTVIVAEFVQNRFANVGIEEMIEVCTLQACEVCTENPAPRELQRSIVRRVEALVIFQFQAFVENALHVANAVSFVRFGVRFMQDIRVIEGFHQKRQNVSTGDAITQNRNAQQKMRNIDDFHLELLVVRLGAIVPPLVFQVVDCLTALDGNSSNQIETAGVLEGGFTPSVTHSRVQPVLNFKHSLKFVINTTRKDNCSRLMTLYRASGRS